MTPIPIPRYPKKGPVARKDALPIPGYPKESPRTRKDAQLTSRRKEGPRTMKDTLPALFVGLLKLAVYAPVILILLILKEALTFMAWICTAGDHQDHACDHKFPVRDHKFPAGDPHHPSADPQLPVGKQAGP